MKFIVAPTIILFAAFQHLCLASAGIRRSGRIRSSSNKFMGHGDLRSLVFASQDQSTWERIGQDLVSIERGSQFGDSTAISADGKIVAVGARFKDGTDGFSANVGSVRIFGIKNNGEWVQMGSPIDGQGHGDRFGKALALSSNGEIVAIGSSRHNGRGHVQVYNYDRSFNLWFQLGDDINGRSPFRRSLGWSVSLDSWGERIAIGDDPDEDGNHHVRIFDWDGIDKNWKLVGDIETKSTSLSLSGDGNILVVAFGDQNNGEVNIFEKKNEKWIRLGQKLSGTGAIKKSISSSHDGKTFAVGGTGVAQIYRLRDDTWSQVGADIVANPSSDFGISISLDGEGDKVVIGAPGRQAKAGGCSPHVAGFVRIFKLYEDSWASLGEFGGREIGDRLGFSVGFSRDGGSIIMGAPRFQCMKQKGYAQIQKLSQTPSPTLHLTVEPSSSPILAHSMSPSIFSSIHPTLSPSEGASVTPSARPTMIPSATPTSSSSGNPSTVPTVKPTFSPSLSPSTIPTPSPTLSPSDSPSIRASTHPTMLPSKSPTRISSDGPSPSPSMSPTIEPSPDPTNSSSGNPDHIPSYRPTESSLPSPSRPKLSPTLIPQTSHPTAVPTHSPTASLFTNTPTTSQKPTSWTPKASAIANETNSGYPFSIALSFGGGVAIIIALGLIIAFITKRRNTLKYMRMSRRRIIDDDDIETFATSEKKNISWFATNSFDSESHQYDAFLSCNWGIDGDARNNHERVSKINDALKKKGVRTYFQEGREEAKKIDRTMKEIGRSEVVLAFLTDKYIANVAGKGEQGINDYCKQEFEYALRSAGNENIIPVVMERACTDAYQWNGPVGLTLGSRFYHRFIIDNELDNCVTGIMGEITRRKLQKNSGKADAGIEALKQDPVEPSPIDILLDIESEEIDWADTVAEGLPWFNSPNNSPSRST